MGQLLGKPRLRGALIFADFGDAEVRAVCRVSDRRCGVVRLVIQLAATLEIKLLLMGSMVILIASMEALF